MSWVITPSNLLVDDQDALTYLTAVEAADGQALESGVRLAVNAFVKGCKADGIWPAIKASCILAGARTLTGALVPLVGTAPTNFNFVAGDYNRETGLVGDGSTKYLDSNRANNADPQNNQHLAIYGPSTQNQNNQMFLSGSNSSLQNTQGQFTVRSRTAAEAGSRLGTFSLNFSLIYTNVFFGVSRNSSSFINRKYTTIADTVTVNSESPSSSAILVFANPGPNTYSPSRLAFYSIGESLDLALLDTRVTTLVNAFAAAIP